mgnify:CR=1 FL=1
MDLETMAICDGIDLSDCHTRKDKISKIIASGTLEFTYLFSYLTEEEKEHYFYNLQESKRIDYLATKNDEFIFNYIINNYKNLEEFLILRLTRLLKTEKLKYEVAMKLIANGKNFYITSIIDLITSDILKMKLINRMIKQGDSEFDFLDFIKSLKDDKNKELFIPSLSIFSQVDLIKCFKDKNLKKQYSLKKEYSNYRSILVAANEDPEFIKEQFLRINIPIFQNNLISLVTDSKLKLELISLLKDKNVQKFHMSNIDEGYNNFKVEVNSEEIAEYNIDDAITIGIELECCNKNINNYKKVKTVFKDFEIKSDCSVKSGFEIVSPILHYTKEDMTKLKSVCEILKDCKFYTDSSCGGHIHIGADYLESTREMYMLLYLYNNCENIIYLICNKEHSKTRKSGIVYAKKIKNDYLKASKNGSLNENLTKEEMIKVLEQINETRYKGLNLQNLDNYYKKTIEFRMPNGEIEFDELILNVKLFTTLIQKAHDLVNANASNEIKMKALRLSDKMKEEDRLEIFLSILFDTEEEKNVYRRRYKTNKAFFESLTNKLFYKNENFIEIDEDSKRLSKKSNQ